MMLLSKSTYLVFATISGFSGPASVIGSPGGCCSLNYKDCISWCGNTENSCASCNHHDGLGWLVNGPPKDLCVSRWTGCENKKNACCDGLTCKTDGTNNYLMCLPINPIGTKEPTAHPTDVPTFVSTPLPTSVSPTLASPTSSPSYSSTSAPTVSSTESIEPCCSLDYKNCIDWCGPTYNSCASCNHHDGVGWLQNGQPKDKCLPRWTGCENNADKCCDGLTCKEDTNNYLMCLPISPIGTKEPTVQPTDAPTVVVSTTKPTSVSPTSKPTLVPTNLSTPSPTAATLEPTVTLEPPTFLPTSTGSSTVSSTASLSASTDNISPPTRKLRGRSE